MLEQTGAQPTDPGDRRLAILGYSSVALFVVLLLIVPAFAVGFDEAKYLGIGASIWAGRGPETAFGTMFLLHSPLWMFVLYAPQALAGFDAVWAGHILDGLAGAGVVALTVTMARRSSPVAGVIGGFAILAFSYLFHLTRTTRLDVPAAAMALLYLEVGWQAVRRGSIRWAIAAGLTFAVAVMVKEVAIPLAPAPVIFGVLADVPWKRLLRTTGWLTLAASVGLAPWFLYYAAMTGHVYRVESAAWTLPVLFLPVLALIVVCLSAGRLADVPRVEGAIAGVRRRLPARLVAHGRPLIGWGTAIAWSLLFLWFFSRISRLKGAPIYQLTQWKLYLGEWKLELVPIGLFIALGLVLALVMLWRDRGAREHRGVVNALVASICGLPLVIMVVQVGEPPRNYIAQVATAVVVAAGGCSWALSKIAGRLTEGGRRPAIAKYGVVAVLAVAVVGGTLVIGGRAYLTRSGGGGLSVKSVTTVDTWVRANVPTGTSVAFGSFLGYEMAYGLVGDYELHLVRHKNVIVDPAEPEGFKRVGEPSSSDWVGADTAPRNINEYQAFRAAWVESQIKKWNVQYWVYTTGLNTSAPSILPQLTPDHGFTLVASWDFSTSARSNHIHIFKVDPANVKLDTSKLYVSTDALVRLTAKLAQTPAQSQAAAAALVKVLVVYDPSPEADAAMAQLKMLAGS